jgi:hypothetical protein
METFLNRPYDTSPYLVIPLNPFRVKLGSSLPPLIVYAYTKDNLFGDPVPLGLSGFTISLALYSSNNVLSSMGTATITDSVLSQISYNWNEFDLKEIGNYYGDFIFKDSDTGKSFIIPTRERLQVIVY